MMSQVILGELRVVGVALLGGALITFVYDLLRIFRRVVSHGNLWIGVEDFVFWIWTALWIFSVLYRENDGSFRMYTIFAMMLGMICYHKTLSDPFVKVTGKILNKLLGLAFYPLKMLKIYMIFLGKKLKKLCKSIIMKKNEDRQ